MSNKHVPNSIDLLSPGTALWTPQSTTGTAAPICATPKPDPISTFVVQKQVGKNNLNESQNDPLSPSCPSPDSGILFLSKSGGTSPTGPTVFGRSVNPISTKLAPKVPAEIEHPMAVSLNGVPATISSKESNPVKAVTNPPIISDPIWCENLLHLDNVNTTFVDWAVLDDIDSANEAYKLFVHYCDLVECVCAPPRLIPTKSLRAICRSALLNLQKLFSYLSGPLPWHWDPDCPTSPTFEAATMVRLRLAFSIARRAATKLKPLPPTNVLGGHVDIGVLEMPLSFTTTCPVVHSVVPTPQLLTPLPFSLVAPPLTLVWDIVVAPPHILVEPLVDLCLTLVDINPVPPSTLVDIVDPLLSMVDIDMVVDPTLTLLDFVIMVDPSIALMEVDIEVDPSLSLVDPPTLVDPPPLVVYHPILVAPPSHRVVPLKLVALPLLVDHLPTLVFPPNGFDPPWWSTWDALCSLCLFLASLLVWVDPPWLCSFFLFLAFLPPWTYPLFGYFPFRPIWIIPWQIGWPPTFFESFLFGPPSWPPPLTLVSPLFTAFFLPASFSLSPKCCTCLSGLVPIATIGVRVLALVFLWWSFLVIALVLALPLPLAFHLPCLLFSSLALSTSPTKCCTCLSGPAPIASIVGLLVGSLDVFYMIGGDDMFWFLGAGVVLFSTPLLSLF